MKSPLCPLVAAFVCLTVLVPCRTQAADLGVGDPAPAIAVKKFLKGKPVPVLPKGQVSVVAFWTPDTGPNRDAIPKLTALAQKYPQVTFLGVSVGEDDPSTVAAFVKAMGARMDYHIALDKTTPGTQRAVGTMATTWLKAAGVSGTPEAFLIAKDGRIAWMGSPEAIAEPLARIIAGTWDMTVAIEESRKRQADMLMMQALVALKKEAMGGDRAAFFAVLNQAITAHPQLEKEGTLGGLGQLKFVCLLKAGDTEAALLYGRRLLDTVYTDDASALDVIAVASVDPDSWSTLLPADLAKAFAAKADAAPADTLKPSPALTIFALQVAQRADIVVHGRNAEIADTLATARFANGDAVGAVAAETRAIQLCGSIRASNAEAVAEMRRQLAIYQKASEAGK